VYYRREVKSKFKDAQKKMKMYRLAIREVAEKNGIANAYQLQKAADLQPSHAAAIFKGELRGIKMETLNKICHALGCEPKDLFVLDVPKKAKKKPVK
jgi:DNA-binding Xre family transcriptional regulator